MGVQHLKAAKERSLKKILPSIPPPPVGQFLLKATHVPSF